MNNAIHELYPKLDGLDEKSIQHLSEAIERRTLEGFDYLKFKKSVNTLMDMMDEIMAIKSSYATAKNMGLTKEKLLKSIEYYRGVLDNEKEQFDDALKQQIKQKLDGKREEKKRLVSEIAAIKSKIEQLQGKIEAHQEVIDRSDDELKRSEERINLTKDRFNKAYQGFNDVLSEDYDKISQNI